MRALIDPERDTLDACRAMREAEARLLPAYLRTVPEPVVARWRDCCFVAGAFDVAAQCEARLQNQEMAA